MDVAGLGERLAVVENNLRPPMNTGDLYGVEGVQPRQKLV
jgi:hypothetical protein